jgi:hypothetical protein
MNPGPLGDLERLDALDLQSGLTSSPRRSGVPALI